MVNKAVDKALNFLETYVCAVVFAAMCSVIMVQIILRTLGLPLAWTEETARYLFVWVIYLASSKAVKNGKHMSVDILPLLLRGKSKLMLLIISQVISLIFFLILLYYGAQVLQGMAAKPQYSAAMGTNMIIPYAAPTVGSALMVVRGIQNLMQELRELTGRTVCEEVVR